ncbi:MAG: hypothetical protein IKU36_06310 [Bacteroidales bacterium]|nr:hypothetical protein [Bacteroidales bacterium]
MTDNEALKWFKETVEWYEKEYPFSNPHNEQVKFYKVAIKAINMLSTVTDGKFHDMQDNSPMLQYKQGWNDALEAIKVTWEAENESY